MSRVLFDPRAKGRPMRVAAFMSGSGTNIRRLLERKEAPYRIVFIFSDTADDSCRGQDIAREYGLPYIAYDTRRFHQLRGLKRTVQTPEGLAARREYDQVAARLLRAFDIDLIALGGYMSFLTLSGGVNVHPADLSLVDEQGRRRFVGDDAVYEAIAAGQTELRSSTLWIDQGVDTGPLLMVSDPPARGAARAPGGAEGPARTPAPGGRRTPGTSQGARRLGDLPPHPGADRHRPHGADPRGRGHPGRPGIPSGDTTGGPVGPGGPGSPAVGLPRSPGGAPRESLTLVRPRGERRGAAAVVMGGA